MPPNRVETYGSQLLTRRYTSVDGDGVAVSFPEHSVKEFLVHIEGDTELYQIEGNTSFTGSGAAHITSNGLTQVCPVSAKAGGTLCTITAPSGTAKTLLGAAVDLTGTVKIPCATHGFSVGDVIQISGTDHYDDTYTLPTQTGGDANNLVITADYVAETFGGTETARELTTGVLNISVVAWR